MKYQIIIRLCTVGYYISYMLASLALKLKWNNMFYYFNNKCDIFEYHHNDWVMKEVYKDVSDPEDIYIDMENEDV